MGNVSDGPQTGRGYEQTRMRYIRRTRYLMEDPDFNADVASMVTRWNLNHPTEPIGIEPMPENLYAPPQAILKRIALDAGDDMERILALHQTHPLLIAWQAVCREIVDRYLPRIDFSGQESAGRMELVTFVSAVARSSSASVWWNVNFGLPGYGDREPSPPPQLHSEAFGDAATFVMSVNANSTRKDLDRMIEQALLIARRCSPEYSLDSRISALRGEDMSHREIADRLGMETESVRKHLAELRKKSPSSSG